MGLKIKNTFNVARVKRELLQPMAKKLNSELLDAAAEIVQRTLSGRDMRGGEFRQYAPMTKRKKIAEGKQSDPVNLTETGQMLKSIKTTVQTLANSLVGRIFFTGGGASTKASKHMQGAGVPKREFFGLSKEQVEKIRKGLKK